MYMYKYHAINMYIECGHKWNVEYLPLKIIFEHNYVLNFLEEIQYTFAQNTDPIRCILCINILIMYHLHIYPNTQEIKVCVCV